MWLYIPSRSAAEPPGLNSDWNFSSLEDLSRSVTLSGKSPRPTSLRRISKRANYRLLRSGLMCDQSALQASAISWGRDSAAVDSDLSPGATPASPSVSPASGLAQTILATYGPRLLRRLACISRISSSSRMSQGTFNWDSERSAEISKTEATAYRRVCSRRGKLVRRTNASGCLFSGWLTPHGISGIDHSGKLGAGGRIREAGNNVGDTENDHGGGESAEARKERGAGGMDLLSQADGFELSIHPTAMNLVNVLSVESITPIADAPVQERMRNSNTPKSQELPMLDLWPTPAQRDYKGCNSEDHLENGTGRKHLDQLPNFIEHLWGTPRASDGEKGGPNQSFGAGGIPLAAEAAQFPFFRQVRETSAAGETSSTAVGGSPQPSETTVSTKRLNPLFVEWLMGWPLGWTACGPVGMESYLWKQRRHFYSYLLCICFQRKRKRMAEHYGSELMETLDRFYRDQHGMTV